jgi:integrase
MVKLTASAVRGLRTPGKYSDGNGLLLHVVTPHKRYWVFRFQRQRRERAMSLGNADVLSLADAHRLHAVARVLLARGIDPLAQREQAKAAKATRVNFSEAVETYIEAHQASWRGYRAVERWRQCLADYAVPAFGQKPVGEVGVEDVLRALTPIWTTKTMTASRVRSRIEQVLDYAKARGWRQGENPAMWRGNMKLLLPPSCKLHTVQHRAALPWQEAPALFATLREASGVASLALTFLVLTACRSGEVRGCRWSEIDMERQIWVIPPSRMKTAKEHRVPLSEPAIAVLRRLWDVRTGELVFFSVRQARPLADTTLKSVLRRLEHGDVTVHGFRSTFRDWCADSGRPADIAEAALAHLPVSKIVAAYQRSDLLEARRGLMDAWASFLTRPATEVVPLRKAG